MDKRESTRAKVGRWLDERTGYKGLMRRTLDEPIRGGARWAYVFGSTLLFLFALQALTGMFLAMYYVPSADHAHATVAYIQKAVAGGALLRGLHYYGASALVVLVVAHMVQAFLFGSYKGKRELLWVVGVVLFLLILGFAFTGYLLPWDQDAYFGTKVGTSIAGEVPVIGPMLQRVMLGGSELTSLTISRFYMIHAFLLPAVVVLLVVGHVYLFRHAGPAGPYHSRDDRRVERFYPRQLLKDSIFVLVVFSVLVGLALLWPARLGPQADPTTDYLARPAWYFLPLFELLKYFPGGLSVIPTVVLPGVLFTLIFSVPFFDRRKERHPLRRPVATASVVFILAGAAGLMAISKYADVADPAVSAKLEKQERQARAFLETPFQPQEVGGATTPAARAAASNPAAPAGGGGLLSLEPTASAAGAAAAPPVAFENSCAHCHGARGEGDVGPSLFGVTAKPGRSKDDLVKLLGDTKAYGLKEPMPDSFPELTEADKRAIAEWLATLRQ